MPEIAAADFQRWLAQRLKEDTEVVRAAALDAVVWGERQAVKLTDAENAVDQGQFRLAWTHGPLPKGAELRNDAPYAAVLELGRRPGRPGPPLAPIYAWVQRKLRGDLVKEYRFVKRLALGLTGVKATRKKRAEARKEVRKAFGPEERGVMAKALAVAMSIRDAIHFRGTKPKRILRRVVKDMKPRFVKDAVRRLRAKARKG